MNFGGRGDFVADHVVQQCTALAGKYKHWPWFKESTMLKNGTTVNKKVVYNWLTYQD